jgi:hypothetical protein
MYVENLVRLGLIYVKAVGYDAETKVLEVEFKSGGIYQYAGVQPEMYADLLAAESVGRFVSQVVRAGRRGLKIEEEKGGDDGSGNR